MRKDKPTRYLNTPFFMGIRKQIKAADAYTSFAWTLKADFPTAFLFGHLQDRLAQFPEILTGTYIETCNNVLMGYFGNLEVTSKTGMKRCLEQFDGYYINGGSVGCGLLPTARAPGNMVQWGEDFFIQCTTHDAEVMKKSAFKFDRH